jgi:hypothetical protein
MEYILGRDGVLKPNARNKAYPVFPSAVAYIDKLQVWFRWLSWAQREVLLQQHGQDLFMHRCRVGWMVVVKRLTEPLLAELHSLMFQHGGKYGCISRVDVAFDWPFATQAEADNGKNFLKRHHHLRYRRDQRALQSWVESDAFASIKYSKGSRKRSQKNAVGYSDRKPKIKAQYSCHFELRLLNATSCKRAGIVRLIDVLQLNPAQLFTRWVKLGKHKGMRGTCTLTDFSRRHKRQRRNIVDLPMTILQLPDRLQVK